MRTGSWQLFQGAACRHDVHTVVSTKVDPQQPRSHAGPFPCEQGWSHNSVNVNATMAIGIMGCDSLALIGSGSRGLVGRKEKA